MKDSYGSELRSKQLSFNFDFVESKKSHTQIVDLCAARQSKNLSKKAISKSTAISALLKEAQSLTW